MNERVMQFRIGMFVIVAGLVLTMLIVWFGESPSLLRDQIYLKAQYAEAPGVLEGVAVRKSGIRVGEVVAIAFDERPNQPDGVLVTMAIERKYPDPRGLGPAPQPLADRRCDHRPASRHRQGEPATGPHAGRGPGHRGRRRRRSRQGAGRGHHGVRAGRRHPQEHQRGRQRPGEALEERRPARRLPQDLDQDGARPLGRVAGHRASFSRPTRPTSAPRWPTSRRWPTS